MTGCLLYSNLPLRFVCGHCSLLLSNNNKIIIRVKPNKEKTKIIVIVILLSFVMSMVMLWNLWFTNCTHSVLMTVAYRTTGFFFPSVLVLSLSLTGHPTCSFNL